MVVDDHQPGHRWARTYPLPARRAQNTAKACVRAVQHAKNPPKSGGNRTAVVRRDLSLAGLMAKDTEKLIRQLSLISYLMAERRPVTALEIRRDVEGYSGMNEDAFARRFYADRSELESLGIQLTVDRPPDGVAEQENYSLRPENFHLPAIAFTDGELAALQHRAVAARRGVRLRRAAAPRAAADLVGPPEPAERARAAAGRPRHHRPPPAATSCRSASRRSRPRSSAARRSSSTTTRWSATRPGPARSTRTTCSSRAGSSTSWAARTTATRSASSACRACAARSPYATKAEHDFQRPTREEFDPRDYASRAAWQFGETQGIAEVLVSERIAWQVERHFGRFGEIRPGDDGSVVFATPYASARMLASWVLRLGEHVQVLGPPELVDEVAERVATLAARHADGGLRARRARRPARAARRRRGHGRPEPPRPGRHRDPPGALRAPRHARVDPHRGRPRGELLDAAELQERLQISDRELREDINVLNVVNFGGGSYVLYAEVSDDGHDRGRPRALRGQLRAPGAAAARRGQGARRRDRPDRRAPARGRADVGAGEDRRRAGRGPHRARPAGRERGRRRLAIARVVCEAIAAGRLLRLDYYKPNEDEFVQRTIEPYALINGREGWYVASFDPARDDVRHFRLDRIRNAEVTEDASRAAPRSTRRPTSTAGRAPAR